MIFQFTTLKNPWVACQEKKQALFIAASSQPPADSPPTSQYQLIFSRFCCRFNGPISIHHAIQWCLFIFNKKKRHQFHNIPQHQLSHEGLRIVSFSFSITMEITLFREVKDRTSHEPWLPIANCSITRCYVPITFHWHPLAFQL